MWIKFLFVSTPAFDFIIFNGVCFCMWLDYVHILTSQNKLTLQNPSCYKTVTFSVTEPKQYLTWQNQMSQITNGSAGEMTTDQSKPRIMDKGITHIFQLSFRVTRVAVSDLWLSYLPMFTCPQEILCWARGCPASNKMKVVVLLNAKYQQCTVDLWWIIGP